MCMGAVSGQGEGRRMKDAANEMGAFTAEGYLPRAELLEQLGRLQTENESLNRRIKDLNDSDDYLSREELFEMLGKLRTDNDRLNRRIEDLNDTIDGLRRAVPVPSAPAVHRMTFEDLAKRLERIKRRMECPDE